METLGLALRLLEYFPQAVLWLLGLRYRASRRSFKSSSVASSTNVDPRS